MIRQMCLPSFEMPTPQLRCRPVNGTNNFALAKLGEVLSRAPVFSHSLLG